MTIGKLGSACAIGLQTVFSLVLGLVLSATLTALGRYYARDKFNAARSGPNVC
jgi:hypothetical protein